VDAAGLGELRGQKAVLEQCETVILDINLGPGEPSGLDVYRWLREQGFAGRIVFLTGHAADHPLVSQAYRLGAHVLQKPARIQRLLAAIGRGSDTQERAS
jgi:FixJ family two-component response regulator